MRKPKILTKLRIDEISSVDRGAGEGCKIMLYKRDDTPRQTTPYLFNDIMKINNIPPRYEQPGDEDDPRIEDDDNKLTSRLRAMVAVMIKADPSKTEQEHLYDLLHTAHGRRLYEHLSKSISKTEKESPMPQVDIRKLKNIDSVVEIAKHISANGAGGISEHEFSEILMGHAKLSKRDKESDAQAFTRIITDPTNVEIHKAYAIVREGSHLAGLTELYKGRGLPNLMSVEPVFTEVGSSEFEDDSAEAIKQLNAMAEKQHRTFEEVFQDPANRKLAARTYPRRDANWHNAATPT